jgi:hypothetical protein
MKIWDHPAPQGSPVAGTVNTFLAKFAHLYVLFFRYWSMSACAGDMNRFRADGVARGSVANDNAAREVAKSDRRKGHRDLARSPRLHCVGAIIGQVDVTRVINGFDDEGGGGDVCHAEESADDFRRTLEERTI